ncbi:MAG: nucleoside recognition domain-containing protein [Bacillota bacterium]
MLNLIWLMLLIFGIAAAAIGGDITIVTRALTSSAKEAIDIVLGFIGIICFWLGMMRIAEKSGLVRQLARLLDPLINLLFPSIPPGHPAKGSIMMNMAANLLGMGSAATPLGLKAMEELQQLNPDKSEASPAMCTFLAVNTSAITLIPATVVALRAAAGSRNPTEIVGTTLVATFCSSATAIILDAHFRRRDRLRRGRQ